MPKEDSLKKRYIYKLSTNLTSAVINFLTQAIIPRGLGPKAYGDFNFLNNFFSEFINFFDMGTSFAFYTKLSQRKRESGLVFFYLYFCGIIFLLVFGFVIITNFTSLYVKIWPMQQLFYIYLAAFFSILTWFAQRILTSILDAYGITVFAEKVKIFFKIVGLVLISLLFIYRQLNLTTFFYYNYFVLLLLTAAFFVGIKQSGYFSWKVWQLTLEQIRRYLSEFYRYSHPLFIYILVGLIVGIFDRWLLQVYGGSVQQGFFSLSYQIGILCFLFTGAMTPLIMREFSISFGKQDLIHMAYIFRRYIPLLYSIAAYFSCFIAFQADKVIYIFGGSAYREAVMVVIIMAFYPIHQTYGQLSNSMFYATGQTRLYRNIGVTFMLIGLPLTYILIAPKAKMGFDTGAAGLAVKMVLLQFITANVMLYFNAKFLKLPFWKYFGHQIVSLAFLLILASISVFTVNKIFCVRNIIMNIIVSGSIYTLLVVSIIYYVPLLFGLTKGDIQHIIQIIHAKNYYQYFKKI